MTISEFNRYVDGYQQSRTHTQWINTNLPDLPACQTPEAMRAAWTAAIDQEQAALRDLLSAARKIKI